MDKRYLIDTKGVIDYLNNKLPEKTALLLDNLEIQLSVITRIELLSWNRIDHDQLTVLEGFLDISIILDLSEVIVLKTIDIRKTSHVKLPDAIIAATAMVHDLILVTRNISDFKNIAGLNLLDSWRS